MKRGGQTPRLNSVWCLSRTSPAQACLSGSTSLKLGTHFSYENCFWNMPAKITTLRIWGQLLLRLQANDLGPVPTPESFQGWFPRSGHSSSRCSGGGHVSTPSKVERIKLISFMTRGKFEIGSSEMKRERQEQLLRLPTPLLCLPPIRAPAI